MRGWPAERQERLRALVNAGVSDGVIAGAFNVAEDTIKEVRRRLGIRRGPTHRAWTADEDATLFRIYSQGGVKASRDGLPGRSDKAIYLRAKQIGVIAPPTAKPAPAPKAPKPERKHGFIHPTLEKTPPASINMAAFDGPGGVSLTQLRPADCKWPFGGDPSTMRFCAAPRRDEACPYCAEHARMAYAKPSTQAPPTDAQRLARALAIQRGRAVAAGQRGRAG